MSNACLAACFRLRKPPPLWEVGSWRLLRLLLHQNVLSGDFYSSSQWRGMTPAWMSPRDETQEDSAPQLQGGVRGWAARCASRPEHPRPRGTGVSPAAASPTCVGGGNAPLCPSRTRAGKRAPSAGSWEGLPSPPGDLGQSPGHFP